MALTLFYHPTFLLHLTGGMHPERPERLTATRKLLEESGLLSHLKELEPRPAKEDELQRVHAKEHIDRVRITAQEGGGYLDSDTVVSSSSYEAASRAAGAAVSAVDEVVQEGNDVFCLVRPPGHHATSNQGMGFCLFNNLAVGAAHSLSEKKHSHILIIDWDAHHGNGLQEIFYGDRRVLYVSLHQSPLYPGSGSIREVGSGEGKGYNINIPFPPRTGEEAYLKVFEEVILPAAKKYAPQLVMIAAGYDGHFSDPLASLLLKASSFSRMTAMLKAEFKLPFIVSLEGGYDLKGLALSVFATICELASLPCGIEKEEVPPGEKDCSFKVIEEVKHVHSRYWPL